MTTVRYLFNTATVRKRSNTPKRRNTEISAVVTSSNFKIRNSTLCKGALAVLVAATLTMSSACVRRTITITTEPPNARVFLNDQEVGRSAVTTDFLWYGDYGVTIRKEGYETLQTNWVIKRPWYQYMPLDFFSEVLWPGQLHDTHSQHYVLAPEKIPTQEELIGRAVETRDRALDARK